MPRVYVKKPEYARKDYHFSVPLPRSAQEKIARIAEEDGLTPAAFARRLILIALDSRLGTTQSPAT